MEAAQPGALARFTLIEPSAREGPQNAKARLLSRAFTNTWRMNRSDF